MSAGLPFVVMKFKSHTASGSHMISFLFGAQWCEIFSLEMVFFHLFLLYFGGCNSCIVVCQKIKLVISWKLVDAQQFILKAEIKGLFCLTL